MVPLLKNWNQLALVRPTLHNERDGNEEDVLMQLLEEEEMDWSARPNGNANIK